MSHCLYIITGANKGFGEALAQTIASSLKTTDLLRFILIGRHIVTLESVAHTLQRQSHVLSVDIIAESHGLDNATTTFDMVLRALDPVVSSAVSQIKEGGE
jgi:sepiapterin reductase